MQTIIFETKKTNYKSNHLDTNQSETMTKMNNADEKTENVSAMQ